MMRVVVIPALEPDERLIPYVKALLTRGFNSIVVIDDGSGASYTDIFSAIDAMDEVTLLRHDINRGKGAALRTAFASLKKSLTEPAVIVTADSDGQHAVEDVWNVAERLEKCLPARTLVLGTRDFSGEDVPFKSRMGNRITSTCFRLACRIKIPDTQTGLRAFSSELLEEMLSIKGDRYEYEMRVLAYAARNNIALVQHPIETVYENGNAGSHFNPWRDSAKIYKALFGPVIGYALASLTGTVVDFLAFYLLSAYLLRGESILEIACATLLARFISAAVNYLLNRHFVFRSRAHGSAVRYAMLVVGMMVVSSGSVYLGVRLFRAIFGSGVNAEALKTALKAIVDTILFIVNYHICGKWVFPPETWRRQLK